MSMSLYSLHHHLYSDSVVQVNQGNLSRQGSQPGLAHQFGAQREPLEQAHLHSTSSAWPGVEGSTSWPLPPNTHFSPGPQKAAGAQPTKPSQQQHRLDPAQAGRHSTQTGPSSASIGFTVSNDSQTSSLHRDNSRSREDLLLTSLEQGRARFKQLSCFATWKR